MMTTTVAPHVVDRARLPLPAGAVPAAMAVGRDGRTLWVVASHVQPLLVKMQVGGEAAGVLPLPTISRAHAVADGRFGPVVAGSCPDGRGAIVAVTPSGLVVHETAEPIHAVAVERDGTIVAAAAHSLYRCVPGAAPVRQGAGGAAALAVAADGKVWAVTNRGGRWAVATVDSTAGVAGQRDVTVPLVGSHSMAASVSRAVLHVAGRTVGGAAAVTTVDLAARTASTVAGPGPITTVAASADGRVFAHGRIVHGDRHVGGYPTRPGALHAAVGGLLVQVGPDPQAVTLRL